MADITVRPMTSDDADRVLAIYQAGLDAGNASFETTAPTWTAFDAAKLPDHRLVAVDADDTVLGWVAVSPTSSRAVYAGVVEHSRLRRPRRPRPWRSPAAAGRADRLHRGRRHLDHPVRNLPREHRQSHPAPAGRLPRHRHPRAGRPAPRPVARRRPARAAQPRHLNPFGSARPSTTAPS